MSSRSITPVRPLPPAQRRDSGEIVTTRSSGGFLSFQYSYTEVSSRDGRTQVRSKKTQFVDGKLTRESFEGELEGDAHRQMIEEAQRQLIRSLSWFLPWIPRPKWDRD